MTDTNRELNQDQVKLAIDGRSVDWYLQALVSIVDSLPVEMGITLVIGGSVVSGTLIGRKKFFEFLSREFSEAWPLDKARFRDAMTPEDPGTEDDPALTQYLHLADARIISPGGTIPANRGVLWRGKINAVSGFSLDTGR